MKNETNDIRKVVSDRLKTDPMMRELSTRLSDVELKSLEESAVSVAETLFEVLKLASLANGSKNEKHK